MPPRKKAEPKAPPAAVPPTDLPPLNMTCETCVHFGQDKDHYCRRYPPTVNTVYKSMSEKEYTTYPTVEPSWRCGEWTQRGKIV